MVSRSPAERLLSGLPKVGDLQKVTSAASRRAQYSASTKRALIEAAYELFTEKGYAGTSLDEVVARARVTKGALYHHFSGKQGIFEAVFESVELATSKRITKALKGTKNPWDKALAGLRAFLEVVQDPSYQRLVIQEGPAVLGYERFREQEERSAFGLVQDIVGSVLRADQFKISDEMLDTFSRIFFGALSAAGQNISTAEDPALAVARVETAITFVLAGLRSLADQGVALPEPTEDDAPAVEEALLEITEEEPEPDED